MIGNLSRRVSFQVAVNGKTPGGAPVKSFVHSFYAWCSREKSEGGEQYSNQRLVVPYGYKYRAHYQSSINETMRIVDDGVSYNILSVDRDGLFTDITAEKVTE